MGWWSRRWRPEVRFLSGITSVTVPAGARNVRAWRAAGSWTVQVPPAPPQTGLAVPTEVAFDGPLSTPVVVAGTNAAAQVMVTWEI